MMNCGKSPVWSGKHREKERGEGGSWLGHILATNSDAYHGPITDYSGVNNTY